MKPIPKILGIFGFLCLGLSAYGQCEPFFGDLVINEVIPDNKSTATDPYRIAAKIGVISMASTFQNETEELAQLVLYNTPQI